MDEDDIADWAEEWGITFDEAEDLISVIGDPSNYDIPLDEDGRPDADYMQDLADEYGIDVSDLYDMYYGYTENAA